MAQISLLSTDFDGTLTSSEDEGRCVPVLAEALLEAQEAGARWLINTGRSLQHVLEGIAQLNAPIIPDFLVVNERHIYLRVKKNALERESWQPLQDWNQTCDKLHDELYETAAEAFQELRLWLAMSGNVQLWEPAGKLEGLIAQSEEAMDMAVGFLNQLREQFPLLSFQRNSIYLRFCHRDYHKGSTLLRIAQEIGIGVETILAAGDNHNDLQMLDPAYAGYLVCPSNSVPEVQAKVAYHVPFGFLATRKFGAGTADGIRHFLNGAPIRSPQARFPSPTRYL